MLHSCPPAGQNAGRKVNDVETIVSVKNLSVIEDGEYEGPEVIDILRFVACTSEMPISEAAATVFSKPCVLRDDHGIATVSMLSRDKAFWARYALRTIQDITSLSRPMRLYTEVLSIDDEDSEVLLMAKVHDAVVLLNQSHLAEGRENPYELVVKGREWGGLSLVNEPVGKLLLPFVSRLLRYAAEEEEKSHGV